jgi:hypothetical protein
MVRIMGGGLFELKDKSSRGLRRTFEAVGAGVTHYKPGDEVSEYGAARLPNMCALRKSLLH